MENRVLSFSEAILEGTGQLLSENENVVVMGLGVTDPKGVFGTTKDLVNKFGPTRVLEVPTCENGFTGLAVGAALVGARPIITHQRVEFGLLAVEQLINQAAKWYYMTGGGKSVPLVVRMIVGRGWGQGPQHSQSLESWFAHIPGLKVIAPSNASNAKGLLAASVRDDNPVVMIEHRWLHNTVDHVPCNLFETPIGEANVARSGTDVTIVTYSYMVSEALKVADACIEAGVSVEVIDLLSLRPLDIQSVINSVKRTKRLITIDLGWRSCGIGSEIISEITSNDPNAFRAAPVRLSLSDTPIPSSRALANLVYPGPENILRAIGYVLDRDMTELEYMFDSVSDVPNKAFSGPF